MNIVRSAALAVLVGLLPESNVIAQQVVPVPEDPEERLSLLETKENSWQYALAPLTCWAIEASCDGEAVWSVEERSTDRTPKGPYYIQRLHRKMNPPEGGSPVFASSRNVI